MIFLTVGAQMPFDRLVRAVDAWAAQDPTRDVFAQIGRTGLKPQHVRWCRELDPIEFRQQMSAADLVVSHAGMGTIITALSLGRPIVVMPRRSSHRETRNDHQMSCARVFGDEGRVAVAWDENELVEWLDRPGAIPLSPRIPPHAPFQLLAAVRNFIRDADPLPAAPEADAAAPDSLPLPSPSSGGVDDAREAA